MTKAHHQHYTNAGYTEEETLCNHPQEKQWVFTKEYPEYWLKITEWENPYGGGTSAKIISKQSNAKNEPEQNWPEGERHCTTSRQADIYFFCSMCPLEVVERKAAELWVAVRDIRIPCF